MDEHSKTATAGTIKNLMQNLLENKYMFSLLKNYVEENYGLTLSIRKELKQVYEIKFNE